MKKFILSLLFCFSALLPITANAETLTNYLQAEVQIPTNYNENLRIQLKSNNDLCKRQYGNEQYRICSPYVGEYGAKVFSITTNPKISGSWSWQSESTLAFRPASNTQWTPKTYYTVKIDPSTLPENVKLDTYNYSFSTLPQATQLSNQRFWIDTSNKAKHVYSATFTFLYPVENKDQVIRNLSISPQNNSSGLSFRAPEYIWSRNNTRLVVNLPVASMPKQNTLVQISLTGMPTYYFNNGIRINDMPLEQRVDITGNNNLFYVKNAYLSIEYSKDFRQEFILNVETSLQTSTSEVAKNLGIFVLPKKSSDEANVAYEWDKAPVLDKGTKTEFEALSSGVSTKHKFKTNIDPERYINVIFDKDLASESGLHFSNDKNFVLYASAFIPEISFMQNGNILSLEGSKKIAVQTSQLSELKWEAYKIRKPYTTFIANDYFTNNYQNDYYDEYYGESIDYTELSQIETGSIALDGQNSSESDIVYLDMSELVDNFKQADTSGLVRLKLTGMQGDKEVVNLEKSLLITDIGLLIKRNADGTRNVFAYSLSKQSPLKKLEIQILGKNGLPLTSAITNASGMATIDNVESYNLDKRPNVLTAFNPANNDFTFITMENMLRSVETSRFSTQGRMQSLSNFQAYTFAERGLFRPGDMLRFGLIVRNSDNSIVPSLPIKAVLYDPQNVKVFEKSFNMQDTQYGLQALEWQSFDYSPTGVYRLDILTNGNILGTKTVRLEEFQANVLEISTEISPNKTKGWHVISDNSDFTLDVKLSHLYGTGAQDRKVTADLRIEPMALHFNEFDGYVFTDPYADFSSYSNPNMYLPDAVTDKDGKASFNIDLNAYRASKKTYQATIHVEGFEPNGGRAVNTQTSFLFSPATSLLGYKAIEDITNLYYIPQNRDGALEFIQVNSDLKQDNNFTYTFVLNKRKYVNNLVKNSQDEYYYDETLVQEEISRQELSSRNGTITWDMPTENVGEYILSVYAKNSTFALAEVSFNIVGQEVKINQQTIFSELRLQLEKENYNSGDEVELMLSLPYDGFGLITLEADKVLSHTWFKAEAGQSKHRITIPKDYEGRAYFVVSYMKDIASEDIYLSPYTHSIEPILVNIDKRKLDINLNVDSLITSAKDLKVNISSSHDAKAIIFAVDEGILALTDYKSPSPLDYFLKDRALEVSTSQFLDLIMPEFNLAMQESMEADSVMLRSKAYGGGLAMAKQNLLNPFKRKAEPPFVYWTGLVDISKKGSEFTIPVPSYYNGNLRVMAVAVNENAFGSASENSLIRRDIIVSPQMPLMASPNDKVEAGFMIANNGDFERTLELNLNVPSSLKITNKIPQSIKMKANDEVFIPVNFDVLNELGEASLDLVISSQNLEISRQSSISIRPSTPYTSQILLGVKEEAGSISLAPEIPVYPFNAQSELSASYTPNAYIQAYLTYLENATNASSTEAIISKAFPYVLLSHDPHLLYGHSENPSEAEENAKNLINEAIYAIRSNVRYNGLSMWYGSDKANPLLAVYAGDFLLAFRKAGYTAPADIEIPIFDAIRNIAAQRPNTLSDARINAYAIWVLTREGYATTEYIQNLINTLSNSNSELSYWTEDITALLIASSLRIMRFEVDVDFSDYDYSYKNFKNSSFMNVFAAQSLYMRALALSFPEEFTSKNIAQAVEQSLSSFKNGQSTFSIAQAIAALATINSDETKTLMKDALLCNDVDSSAVYRANTLSLSAPLCSQFTINTPDNSAVYYQLITSGYPQNAPINSVSNGLDVSKVLLNSKNEPIETAKVGDILTVQIKANSHSHQQENIVIQDLYSGAFEIVLDDDGIMPYNNLDVQKNMREDRALFFVTLSPEEAVYSYKVRAVNKGTFTLPAVYAESLYDKSLNANGIAKTITIE